MKNKAPFGPPSLEAFYKSHDDQKNRMLLDWLSDDSSRATLFGLIQGAGGTLDFPSRAGPADPCCITDEHPRPPPEIGHTTVRLIADRKLIEQALQDGGVEFSSRPYSELGGGNFTLAFDPATTGAAAQAAQLAAMRHAFPKDAATIAAVAHHACEAAAILSLRAQDFDLAAFAEQAALRFCQYLFGYAATDFRLLEVAVRANYRALVYQVLGRHFASEPLAILEAKQQAGRLLARTAALIDAYAARDDDVLKYCRQPSALSGFDPVLEKLGEYRNDLNGEQRAIVAVGAAVGTVGNVQAAVCIAVKALFGDADSFAEARSLALSQCEPGYSPDRHSKWKKLICGALNRNPPIAFLPRVQIEKPCTPDKPATYRDVLLALGGGTGAAYASVDDEDPLIWGLPGSGKHPCFGQYMAWPMIVEIVRYVMALPGLAEKLDPLDASPIGLKKRWGFSCESYPLSYRRDRRVAQASLNVHMRISQPVKQNADRLREVIRSGAPRIQEALSESRHVHFAWFEFIERDTVLVLHTVYDGDFAAYIQHFALRVGDLFDTLFASIEDAPPSPVNKFPNEFVALLRRYDRTPAGGFFFSAYPRSEAAGIVRSERSRA